MRNLTTAIIAVIAVYVGAQLTIGSMMTSRVADFAAELDAAPVGVNGTKGPIAVRSSDICTLLTRTSGWRGSLSRLAFPEPGAAADELTARYRFSVINGCSKYSRMNMVIADPI